MRHSSKRRLEDSGGRMTTEENTNADYFGNDNKKIKQKRIPFVNRLAVIL